MKFSSLYILTIVIIVSGLVASGIGLFDTSVGGEPYSFVNQYRDAVKIYGKDFMPMIRFSELPSFAELILLCSF
jgi:hypothetical protein